MHWGQVIIICCFKCCNSVNIFSVLDASREDKVSLWEPTSLSISFSLVPILTTIFSPSAAGKQIAGKPIAAWPANAVKPKKQYGTCLQLQDGTQLRGKSNIYLVCFLFFTFWTFEFFLENVCNFFYNSCFLQKKIIEY